ncbi:EAL domain-containing protein [Pseudoalteromonas denitrificans]|uniref:PAS domain S-box-containing protein/diguanylate cyclase (GGDEF) domain-containing protein n=1 Tax=Pseudoalteromonas denitrificans DSM 6059 TaxID=1123010 RepID=A0A1I1DS52_9GAMM|nr:EAL domain-containing protein [Pseudoalteromonas denitrificans]SFB77721.1 PAS domain S-box-containing protein/diguanylate cyclase (GGDEF) domain-containing protein [Pseudoalteromonas denitrificans DSM 6059]
MQTRGKPQSIKLGLMAPLSGLVSIYGDEISNAALIACEEVNQSGGILGLPLELIIKDDGSMPKTAVPTAISLIENDKCQAIIGTLLSNSRIAVAYQVADRFKVPYLNFSFYEGGIHSPYFFHFAALPNQQIEKLITYLTKEYGFKAYFAGSNYECPRGTIDAAKHTLIELGGEVVGEEYFEFGTSSFSQLLENINNSGADFLVPYFAGEDQINFFEQLALSHLKNKIAVATGYFDEVIAAGLSPNVRTGIYSLNSYYMSINSNENKNYLTKLQAQYPKRKLWPEGDLFLTNFGQATYLCILAYAKAVNECGQYEGEILLNALKKIEIEGPAGALAMDEDLQHAYLNTYLGQCNEEGTFNILQTFENQAPNIPIRYMSALSSNTQLNQLSTQYQLSAVEFSHALDMVEESVIILNEAGQILWANRNTKTIFGYAINELEGKEFHRFLIPPRFWSHHHKQFKQFLADNKNSLLSREVNTREVIGYRKNGSEFPAHVYIGKTKVDGTWLLCATISDITEETKIKESMIWSATHDHLTKLPNRQLLQTRLQSALQRTDITKDHVALIFIDLDNFKLVNDTYGHEMGDKLLKIIADILLHSVRPGDTVARFGGDEFVILCDQIKNQYEVIEIVNDILGSLHQPMSLENIEYVATASIGIALDEAGKKSAQDLLRDADAAMYRAKDRGRDQWIFFQDSMHSDTRKKLNIAMGLHDALASEEFHLVIQPAYQLNPFKIKGGEALIRWTHKGQFISPADFIPLAETNGFIYDIGLWVFQQCCKAMIKWQNKFDSGELEYLSVNVSTRQLMDKRLLVDFKTALDKSGINPKYILLEITETAIMEDAGHDLEILHKLKAMGFNIAIDDFGTGYSSFSQLVNLPLDILKIDRCFIIPLEENPQSRTLAKAIIDLAHNLGATVVAEGIEDEYHEIFLIENNCDKVQGFKYSKPIPVEEFEKLIL